jgi:hypothetical protein
MSTRANVKPLTHWAIAKGYTLRFSQRDPAQVRGVCTTPEGPLLFVYDPTARTLTLEGAPPITLTEYGWEVTP